MCAKLGALNHVGLRWISRKDTVSTVMAICTGLRPMRSLTCRTIGSQITFEFATSKVTSKASEVLGASRFCRRRGGPPPPPVRTR